ncbi:hypothetical protein [Gemmatimonas groenlandica]|uniref:hypothetical protein n=1 Tax=Gemmatimonas groenlandica TaxID=2732249 RepID=UPI00197D31AE|nr:hypothetical protein [Gemmatimonas groenlandica]
MSFRFPHRTRVRAALALGVTCLTAYGVRAHATPQATAHFGPGARVLLDAHNAYPERGRWSTRIDDALAIGLPIAIEQDLHWRVTGGSAPQTVVAHDDDALEGAPSFDAHFFARIRPIMERALAEDRRDTWPLITLNLDFKDNTPAHLDAVWALLGTYEAWLTTATRTATPAHPEALVPGPLLVLTGSDTAQRRRFHDDVPVGAKLRAFGAMAPVPVRGATKALRAQRAMRMTSAQHIDAHADNFARWVNFPWSVIEAGGQKTAGAWVPADSARLHAFVQRAHAQGFWIRFYTLDGFSPTEDRGFTASYNFGSRAAAAARWRAAITSGVDFVATDQYAAFTDLRR